MEFILVMCMLTVFTIPMLTRCYFCKNQLNASDRMANGRIRYRAKGTNMPVCRCCAKYRRNEVE